MLTLLEGLRERYRTFKLFSFILFYLLQVDQNLCYSHFKPKGQAQGKATKRIYAMTNSNLFKQAHTMTKATIKAGDNYQVTFGQCLKAIKAEQAKHVSLTVKIVKKLASIDWDYVIVVCFVFAAIVSLSAFISAILAVTQGVLVGGVFFGVVVSTFVFFIGWDIARSMK